MVKLRNFLTYSIYIAVISVFIPISLTANTINNLRDQFMALGGSEEGFDRIIAMVEKAQSSSAQLKERIVETHNRELFNIMIANDFNTEAYIAAYNNIEAEKAQLIRQNLTDMVNLLTSLSVADRRAYAQLLYSFTPADTNTVAPTSNVTQTPNTAQGGAEQQLNNLNSDVVPPSDNQTNASADRMVE